jgi:hypothetical protein
MMPVTLNQPDGLHLAAQASLSQLLEDKTLQGFAGGLLHAALVHLLNGKRLPSTIPLAEALHYTGGPEIYPLLTALLALDAEIHSLLDEERRVLPLPGFMSYRDRLPLDKVPLETVRLPPLNPGGRYAFSVLDGEGYLAVRLDLHQTLRIAGHVRIALSNPAGPPLRLRAVEDRLERQVVEAELIETAITLENVRVTVPLTPMEQAALIEALKNIAIIP